ncbi:hypothetical protein ABZW32_09950 [Streptomyces sp. NPDC004667]|uniref:hypothetical protein n=1 Tax=Streptomyces sp. NPDC004667 TaxID=3154285 RepID=UPI0033B4E733
MAPTHSLPHLHLGIAYGPLTEPMPASPVGQIRPEDIPALQETGRAIWNAVHSTKKPIVAAVRKTGRGGGHRIPRLTATGSLRQERPAGAGPRP